MTNDESVRNKASLFERIASGLTDAQDILAAIEQQKRARPAVEAAFVGPRTLTEEAIAGIWTAVLGLEQVGVNDNFFELGGHSLLATQILSRVREACGVALELGALSARPTVAGLAAEVERRAAASGNVAPLSMPLPTVVPDPARRAAPFPLSDVQQAYWIGRSGAFELGNVATHAYLEFESLGLDVARLEDALRRLIARHDMLRAVVRPDGTQHVLADVPPYEVAVLDLRGQEAKAAAAALLAVRKAMSHQVLPSERWPLFEVRASRLDGGVVRLDGGVVRLHISVDVLIGDAWSWQILLRELAHLYQSPQAHLEPLSLTFRDYLLAERALRDTELYARALAYWRARLPTLPPAPDLPLACSPASLTQPRFVRRQAGLSPDTWRRLKARAARAGLTPSGVLLAAFAETLALWSKSPRFTMNLTLFHRLPLHPQVNDIVGDFTSLTLLAVDCATRDGFVDRARRLQAQLWQDLDHRYVSGVRVLREWSRMQGARPRAMMPVVFTSMLVQGLSAEGTLSPFELSAPGQAEGIWDGAGEEVYSITQTPQVWLDHQVGEAGGGLAFNWDAVADLFPPGLLDDMFAAYCALLHRLADDEAAWRQARPQLLPIPAAQSARRAAVNATSAPVSDALLHELFAAQAAQRPQQAAVIAPDRRLSYAGLARLARQVAHWLRARGAQPNELVAVVMSKGWQQAVAALGVLAAGAAYLPVDPALPEERLHYLLAHGQVRLALTQPWLEAALAWPAGIERLAVADETLAGLSDAPLESVQGPGDLAYVIYTSGSTGLPKGVMIDHRGAVNTLLDINRRFAVGPGDRVLGLSALNFDLSVYDLFGLLAAGGTLVVPEAEAGRDPSHWATLLTQEGVTLWNTVPALMEMLVEYLAGRGEHLPPSKRGLPASLRLVMLSGDWIPVTLPDRIRALAEGAVEIVSLGGATEASIWSILYPIEEVEAGWKSIPYGRPMVNQTFHVLDEALSPRPTWVPGQLYIGGIGLAQGYWRDAVKTAGSFVPHPQTGKRLYRTGDLGRYLPDGDIEFLGRQDLQVKVQGQRIELGEIEAALAQHPAVRAAVAVALDEARGQVAPWQPSAAAAAGSAGKRLVAYVVPDRPPAPPDTSAWPDDGPVQGEDVLLDPLARLRFKLAHHGLRSDAAQRPALSLPAPLPDEALVQAYTARRSYRRFNAQPVTLEQVGDLLSCLRPLELEGLPLPKYRYASAGSLYPVQTYLLVKAGRVAGLEGGGVLLPSALASPAVACDSGQARRSPVRLCQPRRVRVGGLWSLFGGSTGGHPAAIRRVGQGLLSAGGGIDEPVVGDDCADVRPGLVPGGRAGDGPRAGGVCFGRGSRIPARPAGRRHCGPADAAGGAHRGRRRAKGHAAPAGRAGRRFAPGGGPVRPASAARRGLPVRRGAGRDATGLSAR